MTSNHHGLYALGYTRATMAGTKGCETARLSQSQKTGPSSDWSLKLDSMKVESLVIVDQHATVNTFPGLVHTARHTKGGEVVTRQPYRKVWLDHLLSKENFWYKGKPLYCSIQNTLLLPAI